MSLLYILNLPHKKGHLIEAKLHAMLAGVSPGKYIYIQYKVECMSCYNLLVSRL